MPRSICLHCNQPSDVPLCGTCQARGHTSPLEACDQCPYKRTRLALQKPPAKTKPARGQQSLFPPDTAA